MKTRINITIPESLASIEPDLRLFFDAMINKLEANANKGTWEDITFGGLINHLGEEFDELKDAINESNNLSILLEAADVANFAMMLGTKNMRRG